MSEIISRVRFCFIGLGVTTVAGGFGIKSVVNSNRMINQKMYSINYSSLNRAVDNNVNSVLNYNKATANIFYDTRDLNFSNSNSMWFI